MQAIKSFMTSPETGMIQALFIACQSKNGIFRMDIGHPMASLHLPGF